MKKIIKILILVLIASCLPAAQNTSSNSNTFEDNDSDNILRDIGATITYFQLNGLVNTAGLSLNIDYTDSFLIRGNTVHQYLLNFINSEAFNENRCLLAKFETSTQNKVLALSLKSRSFYNNSVGSEEFYFQVEPNNSTKNLLECSNFAITNSINQLYSTSSIAYDLQSLCPNCNLDILSNQIDLVIANGSLITQITTPNLRLNIKNTNSNTGEDDSNNSCTEDTSCTQNNFDCCLAGQCVNHKAVRPEIDFNSAEYQSAIAQINQNPSSIVNYPNIFFLCPNMTDNDSDGDSNTNPDETANLEFLKKQELYNCINPSIDEISLCTKTYSNISQDMENVASKVYDTSLSDISFNFLNPNLNPNNIFEVRLGGDTIYKENDTTLDPIRGSLSTPNDNLIQSQSLTLLSPLPTNLSSDELKITYKIDGTCEKLSENLAKCTKSYIQGQVSTPARPSDHPTSQAFVVPSFADFSYNLIVKVGGQTIAPGSNTWTLSGNTVFFNASELFIFNNQKVDISYFVTSNVNGLTAAKEEAQTELNTICSCTNGINCNFTPVREDPDDINSSIVNYSCTIPQEDTDTTPLQTTIYMSSKTAAHKFFDSNGIYYKYDNISNKKQECAVSSGDESSCTSFEYTGGDKYKPNNLTNYIGFSEIYGTFTTDSDSGVPSTEIDVIKGRTYDVFADEGVYSSCEDCGTDYYSTIAKIFPNSFIHKGGGYLPNLVESRRVSNQSEFNADDMKYGRACFVPATMIPWTHSTNNDVTTQRRNRLQAQHFLFANGYNKDWYGFDYGSLIGSFDGVTWFSIGNQRNIVAKSNKLYLAINSYFSDETLNNSFRITINEVVPVAGSGSSVVSDIQSDGAQCQLAHICSTDNDCVTRLGYDYSCEAVSSIKTPWPKFDDDGNEISGETYQSIVSLIGGTNSEPKRCVYRGRGSLCSNSPSSVDSNDSYAGTDSLGINTCSINTFCSPFSSANFNTKISRFAKAPNAQNTQTHITDKSDLIGMQARIIGRPYNYFGNELPPGSVISTMNSNNVQGMCVPGKSVISANFMDQLNNFDPINNKADTNFEMGQTLSGNLFNEKYLAACTALDSNQNFTYKSSSSNVDITNSNEHNKFAIAQNMTTNIFDTSTLNPLNFYNDQSSLKDQIGYDKNSCMRTPGSSCFTDLDCSVNSWVSNKYKSVSDFNGDMNEAEISYWQEDLVCSTSEKRYPAGSIYPNPNYDATKKRCCRQVDKTFTFYSQRETGSSFEVTVAGGDPKVAGINTNLNDPTRYSRIQSIYDLLKDGSNNYPNLITPNENATPSVNYGVVNMTQYYNQYKTLDAHNKRMCCTENWVREFATGGHRFSGDTGQPIVEGRMRALNWLPLANATESANQGGAFRCTLLNADSAACKMRFISEGSAYEKKWLEWFSKLELMGIPQIFIESYEDEHFAPVDEDQYDGSGSKKPLDFILNNISGTPTSDFEMNSEKYFSAASSGSSSSKFDPSSSRKIFSDKSFACCQPTGVEVDSDTTNSQCCTGQATQQNGKRFCCLNDFSDLSVYTNRYVSSEGSTFNGVPVSDLDVDPKTGYIRKELVKEMGKTMCCSGRAEFGVAISELYIPLDIGFNAQLKKRRFIENSSIDDDSGVGGAYSRFSAGVKWNNHVYCVPSNF